MKPNNRKSLRDVLGLGKSGVFLGNRRVPLALGTLVAAAVTGCIGPQVDAPSDDLPPGSDTSQPSNPQSSHPGAAQDGKKWPAPDPVPSTDGVGPVLIYEDTFDGPRLDEGIWATYEGPATGGRGTWDPKQVRVINGELELTVDDNTMAGLCMCGPEVQDIRYADIELAVRVQRGDNNYSVFLMWPEEADGVASEWPTEGEINIAEISIEDFESLFNLHWGTSQDDHHELQHSRKHMGGFENNVKLDWDKTQRLRLEWRPDRLSIYYSDKLVFETRDKELLSNFSHPMHLAIQQDLHYATPTRSGKSATFVDYVRVYGVTGVTQFLDGTVFNGKTRSGSNGLVPETPALALSR